jgi:tRNA(Glu) U13 pseudouridine synthase TruD
MSSVEDLEWALIRYNGMDDQLLDTDLDKMNDVTSYTNWTGHGQMMSLLLEFSLDQTQYVTMFIREILKRSTEPDPDSKMLKKLQEVS